MTCPNCGTQNERGAFFCANCGAVQPSADGRRRGAQVPADWDPQTDPPLWERKPLPWKWIAAALLCAAVIGGCLRCYFLLRG